MPYKQNVALLCMYVIHVCIFNARCAYKSYLMVAVRIHHSLIFVSFSPQSSLLSETDNFSNSEVSNYISLLINDFLTHHILPYSMSPRFFFSLGCFLLTRLNGRIPY